MAFLEHAHNGKLTRDSQINFAMGNIFLKVRGFTQECFSTFSKNQFFKLRNCWKNLVSKINDFIGNIPVNLGQTSCLNLDKFAIINYISDCDWHCSHKLHTVFFSIGNSFIRNLQWDSQMAKKLLVLKSQKLRNLHLFHFLITILNKQ